MNSPASHRESVALCDSVNRKGNDDSVNRLGRRLAKAVAAGLIVLAGAAFPAVSAWAALGASVTLYTGDPTDIYPGETTRLQITLSNSNPGSAVNNASFSNSLPGTLPNGLKIAGAPTYTCNDPSGPTTSAGAGTLTAVAGTQAIDLSNGVIPARANSTDGTCTIVIPITAGTSSGSSATYTYTIASGAVTGNDGAAVANAGAVNQSINVRTLAKPSISKAFGTSTLVLGGTATTLSVTLTNTNPVPISNFSITDAFPLLGGSAIIQVAAVPGATASCNNGGSAPAFTPLAGATSITATGTIPAQSGGVNGSCTLTVQVEGAQTNGLYTTGARTNSINASSQFTNDIGIAAAANAAANVTVRSPLRVAKAFAHGSLSSGQSDSFTITLYNDGTAPLAVTSFTDDPIDGTAAGNSNAFGLKVTGQSTTCAGGIVGATANNTGVTLTGGTIPAGGSCTVTVNFTGISQTVGVPISYTNTIPQGAVNVGNPAIVSQTASASILVADDLRVTKSATPAQAAPGNPVQYLVSVQNYSASTINNAVITDHLANGLTFLNGTINGNNYTPSLSGTGCSGLSVSGATGSATPAFTIGTVPARFGANSPGTCVVSFWAMTSPAAANGSSTANTIGAGDVCYNAGATCNGAASNTTTGTVTTTVFSASKSFNPAGPVSEGTVSTLTITFSNWSANALTNVSISDTLPTDVGGGQLRIASPANAASTCGSPTITANPGATSLSMNGGTVPARAGNGTGAVGTCFVKVDVIGPAGTYNNTANVASTETYADGTSHLVGPLSTNTATLTYTSSLSATKSFNPASVSSGGRSTVTVRLNNNGSALLSNVGVTDPLPAGMAIAPTPNAYTTCSGATSVTATAGSVTASLSGAEIAGGGSCDFLFDVVATGVANWVNTIPPGNITADGGVRNTVAVSGTLNYGAPTNLTVAKATNPSTLTFPGQVSQLTITINNGSQAVTGLRLADYFTVDGTVGAAPNGMVIAATPAASTTCPGGIVTAVPGGTSVALSGAALAGSASCTVTVNVTSNAVGGITNYIPAGAIVTDQGLSNAGQATTSLTTQSNIGVVKQFSPNVVQPGQRSRLRITFYNPTNAALSNLAVTDTLPAGVTVPAGPSPATTCSGATVSSPAANQVQVSGGTVAAASGGVAASCYAEIDVLVAAQGDYLNTIPAGAVTATVGGAPATNSQPTSDTLRAKSPLVVHKAIAGNTLDAGNPTGFTTGSATRAPGVAATLVVRLDNPNAAALTGAAFTDNLPAGLVVAATPNASTSCAGGTVIATASATSIRLAGGTVPAAGSCTVSVDVLSNISGAYTNTIPAGGVTTFEGTSNAEPTQARLVVSTPPTVNKQFSPAVIPPNGTSTLTLFLGNANASAITLTSALVDTLPTAPGNIVVAAVPNVSKTCPGAVTANAGSGSVTYASGAQIPAGGCTISVNVTGATSGNHVNTIPAGALQTSVGKNQLAANATLSISTLGYISGKVFRDNNLSPNGTFQAGTDTPIAGVAIELRSGASCGGGLVSSATTDALGNYLFSGLPAGTYSVCEPVQPSGTVNGISSAGAIVSTNGSTGSAGVAANPTATTSQTTGIVLNGDGGGGEISGSPNNNFAEVVQSSISGTVFLDQNNNGVQNGADSGIAGVTIQLLDAGNTVVATTVTDGGGNYSFSGLNPGTYSVREPNQPAGTSNGITTAGSVPNGGTPGTLTAVNTLPSSISGIVLPPNTASTANNFAEIPNGRSVSGRVFIDYNNNGVPNAPSDRGVGGQTLTLTGNDINGNAVSLTATTAVDGTYAFTGVPEGSSYTVTQPAQPVATTNGIATPGSTGGTASNPTATSSRIAGINLAGANIVSADNNFAEIPVSRTVSGRVFLDYNNNGALNAPPDRGISGQTLTLTGTDINGNAVSLTTTTAVDGTYAFTGVPEGSGYTVTQPGQPVATDNGIATAGSTGGTASNPTATSSRIAGIDLAGANVTSANNNFAETPVSRTVSGRVFLDYNNNGLLNAPPDRGISGQTLTLTGTDINGNAVSLTATTAVDGTYAFTGVPEGSGYTVTQPGQPVATDNGIATAGSTGGTASNPTATSSRIAGIDLTGANIVSSGNNFAETPVSRTVSGQVFLDYNNNGVLNAPPDRGIAGQTLTLTGTDINGNAISLTTTTAVDGTYAFTGVPEGSGYTVNQPGQPVATNNGIATVGSAGGTASNPTATSSRIAGIDLSGTNIVSAGNNFAETPVSRTVSGRVFLDYNNNGLLNPPPDRGIGGQTLTLTGTDINGNAVSLTATTAADGTYAFTGVPEGSSYTVNQPGQPVATDNGIATAGSTGGTASNPTATSSRIAGINLAGANIASVDNNFAETPVSRTVSGRVFLDYNNNGLLNAPPDRGIGGQTLTLTGTDINGNAVSLTATTAVDGTYAFTGVPEGSSYTVTQPGQPVATDNGIATAGSTGGTASNPTATSSRIAGIDLTGANIVSSGNNFAETPVSRTVSGRVFFDYNNNGVLNGPSDRGIGGQTLTLTGTDINGNAVSLTATTAVDGTYAFTGVPEGSGYTVTQPGQPVATNNGIATAGSTGGTASNPTATSSRITGVDLTGGNIVSANNNFAEIPGNTPDLGIAKTHAPASFGEGSATGYYTLTPSNIGFAPTTGTITVIDTVPAGMTPTSASGTGWTCTIAGQTVTCTTGTAIAAGGFANPIILRVAVANGLAGQTLVNSATISGGGELPGFAGNNTATDPTPIDQSASVQGTVWRDTNHNRILDAGEAKVAGWAVELVLSGTPVATTTSDANGGYAFTGLAPGAGYQIRFREPTTGTMYGKPVPNENGTAYTNGVVSGGNPAGADNSSGTLNGLTLLAGTTTVQQSLPLDPSGVVYDAVTRSPVPGAVVTLSGPAGFSAADVLGGNLAQTTGSNGFYQFLLLGTAPTGTYTLTVTAPAGYLPAPSAMIPACANTLAVAAAPPDPALVQNGNQAPAVGAPSHDPAACPATSGALAGGAGTTQYYFRFNINPGLPSANVVNNHIPLDPVLGAAIVMSKSTPLVNVAKGDLVPYTVTATNTLASNLPNIDVRDQIPPGFKYRSGSATLNGVHVEPTVAGRNLTWTNQTFAASEKKTYKLILVVGSGVSEGEYVNRAWAINNTVDMTVSNIASAAVRIVPDPTFDCSDLIGKVFDDRNANGYQDDGEPGIPNVRVATVRGLLVTTDADGRFHVACADIPQADRGSNFIMKLDERTLPSGYRLTTENPRVVRTTRGKMVKLNFGATIHKVFRLEADGRAFAADVEVLLPEWEGKLKALVRQLKERPSVLRIAYRQNGKESPDLAKRRADAIGEQVKSLYAKEAESDGNKQDLPPLVVETETVAGKEGAK